MLRRVTAGVLSSAYEESGARTAAPVVLLHGFPCDVRAYDDVSPRLVAGVGHNLPQEAPEDFAAAVLALLSTVSTARAG